MRSADVRSSEVLAIALPGLKPRRRLVQATAVLRADPISELLVPDALFEPNNAVVILASLSIGR